MSSSDQGTRSNEDEVRTPGIRCPGAASAKTFVKLRPTMSGWHRSLSLDGQVPTSSLTEARWREAGESTSTPSQSKIMRSMVNRLPDGPLRSTAAKTSQRGYHSFNESTAQWFTPGNGP